MTERVRSEFTADRALPGSSGPHRKAAQRDHDDGAAAVDQHPRIPFFASLLGLGLAGGIANAGRVCINLTRAGTNPVRRRSLGYGVMPVELDSVVGTVTLIAIEAVPLAGVVVLIAGGGAFGGAGTTIHWSALVSMRAVDYEWLT